MNLELVKATSSDAEAMQRMQVESFLPHFERYQDIETSPVKEPLEKMVSRINYEKGCYFKIIADTVLAGCIWVYEGEPNTYYIGIMYISPEFQCKGIGQKVLAIAEELFPKAESWHLQCPADLPINRRCYEKAGYRFTGETRIINDKLTLVAYRKDTAH